MPNIAPEDITRIETAVRVSKLSYAYTGANALSDIDLEVPSGKIYGLIGPDGAGKTTLMRIICTLLKIPAGVVQVHGMDVMENISGIRNIIGYMPQRFSLYQDLTVEQNLDFFAKLFGVGGELLAKRKTELYAFSRLGAFTKRRAGALSGGMKQKLALSCALIHEPKLLVLDEPTYGVDPVSRDEFWDILHDLSAKGTSIIVSTPYMEEALQCDRISMLHKGVALGHGSPGELIERFGHTVYVLRSDDPKRLRNKLTALSGVRSCQLFGASLHVTLDPDRSDLLSEIRRSGDTNFSFETSRSGIEDLFLELMDDSRNA